MSLRDRQSERGSRGLSGADSSRDCRSTSRRLAISRDLPCPNCRERHTVHIGRISRVTQGTVGDHQSSGRTSRSCADLLRAYAPWLRQYDLPRARAQTTACCRGPCREASSSSSYGTAASSATPSIGRHQLSLANYLGANRGRKAGSRREHNDQHRQRRHASASNSGNRNFRSAAKMYIPYIFCP